MPNPLPFEWRLDPSPTEPGRIRLLNRWAEQNIQTVVCEPLYRASLHHQRRVTLNYQVIPAFQLLMLEAEKEGLLGNHYHRPVKLSLDDGRGPNHPDFANAVFSLAAPPDYGPLWGGGWNPRLKRGLNTPSNHASGHAFDLWPQSLPLGRPAPLGHPVHAFAELAESHGWVWGGRFKRRPDPMHFQHPLSPFP